LVKIFNAEAKLRTSCTEQPLSRGACVALGERTSAGLQICDEYVQIEKQCLSRVVTVSSVSGRKPGNPDLAPDVWTQPSAMPIVSEAGRVFIASLDPAHSQFYPVTLVHQKDRSPFGTTPYFYWQIKRFVKVPLPLKASDPQHRFAPDLAVSFEILDPMRQIYSALANDPVMQAALAQIPFWSFWPIMDANFSDVAYQAALEAGLKGLERAADLQMLHVTRVSLPECDQPEPEPSRLRRLFTSRK
jgi:hypothetical protein